MTYQEFLSFKKEFRLNSGEIITYYDKGWGWPMVLFHGWASSSFIWTQSFPVLVKNFRVIAFELPKDLEYYQRRPNVFWSLAEDYEEVINKLRLERITLVGSSMGGGVAAILATRLPEVKTLILANTVGLPFHLPLVLQLTRLPSELRRQLLKFLPLSFPQIVLNYYHLFGNPHLQRKEILNQILEDWCTCRATGEILHQIRYAGLERVFREVKVRTLLIWGRKDRVIPVFHAERIASLLPNPKVEIFNHLAHIPMFEDPDTFTRVCLNFASQV
ncbi:hypothetical protein B5M47_01210 [candidate division CPR3 bacterium 4484_211]|uniref:AB hydrolase-1 domain-containing protein n=1 Tax=candidate division CPR3 bacterium 4484_211 TaxID=1968527 RepID=A0A1W9NYX1_UNCC3|nr:MAG: hypothetical protein B5M47_01210 [candidate division CPR3 bacterium 4484_211]